MKTQKAFYIILITIMLTSCISSSYFQVYKAVPSFELADNETLLVYEDENCKVYYDLWSEGGNIGFQFYNKTDKNIYLNLEESFFVLNGFAYNYYKNRVYTSSKSLGGTTYIGATSTKSVTGINYLNLVQTNKSSASSGVGVTSSTGYSVSYTEEKIVCIPSKTSKFISEYTINELLYRDCELDRYPTKNKIKHSIFLKETSPLVFGNKIAYYLDDPEKLIRFENEFYVSEISNYPSSEMFESKYDEYCGKKSDFLTKYFKDVSPDKFYIKYTKGQNTGNIDWRH